MHYRHTFYDRVAEASHSADAWERCVQHFPPSGDYALEAARQAEG